MKKLSAQKRLEKASNKYDESYDIDSCRDYNSIFYDILCSTHGLPPAEDIAAVLHYLPHFLLANASGEANEIDPFVNERIAEMLSQDEYLKTYLERPNSEKALAWYCCSYAVSFYFQKSESLANNFRDVLSKWTGRDFFDLFEPTLDNVVTHIYGKKCWDAYEPDTLQLSTYKFHRLVNKINNSFYSIIYNKEEVGNTVVTLPNNVV